MHENNGKPEALLWIDFETTGVEVKSCIARDIKDYKAMLETLAVKTGDHK